MFLPNFTDPEFVDASVLNTAFSGVQLGIERQTTAQWYSGLMNPNLMTLGHTGMVANTTIPQGCGVVFSLQGYVDAHGTQAGTGTQTYNTDFTSLIPGAGSVTAYLIASYGTVAQSPFLVTGPPQGHPSYNPNFVPFIAYATTTDTLVLTATLTPPNNTSTLELARTTLIAGMSSLGTLDTSHQRYTNPRLTLSNGLTTDSQNRLLPQLAPNSGLGLSSSGLAVGAGAGIGVSGGTVSALLGSGLTLDGSGKIEAKNGAGLDFDGSGNTEIATTGVTAGTYTAANITVNVRGQLTAASSNALTGRLLNTQAFNAGTYNPTFTPSTVVIEIDMVGGSAGAGGIPAQPNCASAGGGSGAYGAHRALASSFAGATLVVGAGGAGGTGGSVSANPGGNGGASTYGGLTAPGGQGSPGGGTSFDPGGLGALPATGFGLINGRGQTGGPCFGAGASATGDDFPGAGGITMFGLRGGDGVIGNSVALSGGDGNAGLCIIREYS